MHARTVLSLVAMGCGLLLSAQADAGPKRDARGPSSEKPVSSKPAATRKKRAGSSVRDHRREPAARRVVAPVVQVEARGPQVSSHTNERVRVHSASSREVRYAPEREPETPPPSSTLSSEPDRFWHLGVNLGTGPTLANASSAGLSGALDVYAGLRISSFALQGESWFQFRDYFSPGDGLVQSMALLTAQLWLDDQLWIKTGIGSAYLQEDGEPGFARGTALMGGAGYDIVDTRHVVLNLHVKAGLGLYRERGAYSTVTGGVGFTWY